MLDLGTFSIHNFKNVNFINVMRKRKPNKVNFFSEYNLVSFQDVPVDGSWMEPNQNEDDQFNQYGSHKANSENL